jgi:hypothetical protein
VPDRVLPGEQRDLYEEADAGTPQRSVLLIGASQRVLDDTAAGLRGLGYTAQATSDFFSDITDRFDVTRIGLVALEAEQSPGTARPSSGNRQAPSTRESSSLKD